jgi:Uma2 family endonuclease
MTIATDDRPLRSPPPDPNWREDQLLLLQGSWEKFELIQQGCEDNKGLRLSYFDGTIELLMPGLLHEIFSHAIGTLLTIFLAHQGLLFFAMGQTDQKKKPIAAAQPDQSYSIGTLKKIPDLAIEVVFTSGGINKLAKYQAIGVSEVWFWEDGTLALYRLRGKVYERIEQSELEGLKDLDLAALKQHIMMAETDLGEAVRSFTNYALQEQRGEK